MLAVAALAAGVGGLLFYSTRAAGGKPGASEKISDPGKTGVEEVPRHGESGKTGGLPEMLADPAAAARRKPVVCFLTRKQGTPYQAVQRFEPQRVPAQALPGFTDLDELYARQGRTLPPVIAVVEQLSETMADVLGEPARTLAGYRAYMDPADGRILAFDIAMTAGGVPQRMVGHLTRKGVMVEFFRGGMRMEQKEYDFQRETMILPLEMEFIHHSFANAKNSKLTVGAQTFFVPEVLGFVTLVVTPTGKETLAHRGASRECMRYEVRVESGKFAEGAYAAQQMWFDVRDGTLLRRVDYEDGVAVAEMPVTERVAPDALETLQPLLLRPPEHFPTARELPFAAEREQIYTISTRDVPIGRARIKFSRRPAGKDGPAGITASAVVEMDTREALKNESSITRSERAETLYDERLQPFAYRLEGEESGDALATYAVDARFEQGRLRVRQRRDLTPQIREHTPAAVAVRNPADSVWPEPLRRVDLEEAEEQLLPAAIARRQRVETERVLSPGTFLYDFNRVEQLAMILYRLPHPEAQPEPAAGEARKVPLLYQRAALFGVRRGLGGLLTFAVTPEQRSRPKLDDPELEQELEQELEKEDVNLLQVHVRGTLLNGLVLLAPDGRLLQWTEKTGGNDLVFTLDDPIMRRRASNERKLRGQEGPAILRPPWF